MVAADIHVGLIVAHAPGATVEELEAFAARVAHDVAPVMAEATGMRWRFHPEEATRLSSDDPHRAADFLDSASLRMVEGPYDAVVVVTDVALVSRRQRIVPGLVSSVGRVLIISTRDFRLTPRGEPVRQIASDAVRWNAGALVLHLLGHALGLEHTQGSEDTAMRPFEIQPQRQGLPSFGSRARQQLARLGERFPQRTFEDDGILKELSFHLASAARHPRQLLATVWRSRAPLLPLYLPRLATAALAPAVILVFTAEIWDAGFHMTNREVWTFAAIAVLISTVYLSMSQAVFLPQKERRFHTEHLAVVNVAITIVLLCAVVGLFVMVGLLMMVIQLYVFPPDLVRAWPSLDLGTAVITLLDQVRIAALISTVGVLTGALGGGLESRSVLRHLALFRRVP